MRIRKLFTLSIALFMFGGLVGCASMDLQMEHMPMHPEFGQLEPRVPDKCFYVPEEYAPEEDEYIILARYIVQERERVSMSRRPQEMICHAFSDAREEGADAVIVEDMSSTAIAGGAERTSAVIRVKAIRFVEDPPEEFFE